MFDICLKYVLFYLFSNLGYALLGHSLFERFGIGYSSWEDWVFYKILNPIGMTNTVLDNNRYN